MNPPERRLLAAGRTLSLGGRPWLMGIVNASPDSFSGDGDPEGADVLDVGGESARTDRPALDPAQEIERVVPVVQRLAAAGHLVSVDTYKPAVARAAVAAGASIVNDVSGLRDPELAAVCAQTGAALVLMHTVGAPKEKVLDHAYDDVAAEVVAFLAERIEMAMGAGVPFESLVLDPGPDFGKSPAQTVAALRALEALHALGRPLLAAVSRKDFVGALTGRAPRDRVAGTLAAVGYAADAGAHLLRVHDVPAARDYLQVRNVLRGDAEVETGLRLPEALRREE
ncbi:MAG TPA: dihydropteroate synthase [Solirubrobacteraceae bacterium]|nr:dihydropteroate synthase [Solirubrobacteraceae bacterium]